MEEKTVLERAKDVIHGGLDIKELLGFYNFYSSKHWNDPVWSSRDPDWGPTCLSLVKEELFKRGIISSPTVDKLISCSDFTAAPELVVHVNEIANTFEFVKDGYDLEEHMFNSKELKDKVREDDEFAIALYGALCNVDWKKDGIHWSCSWRHAGGIVADLRDCGEDYLHFYCSGNEGEVDTRVSDILGKLGWTPEIL